MVNVVPSRLSVDLSLTIRISTVKGHCVSALPRISKAASHVLCTPCVENPRSMSETAMVGETDPDGSVTFNVILAP
jgi:hypothetical protein